MEQHDNKFTLLKFDKTNLLIPQNEIAVIEMIDTVQLNNENSEKNAVGQFQNDLGRWPVFSISADFSTRDMIMDIDRYCVCLQHEKIGQFGLICTEVASFKFDESELIQSEITEMMLFPSNPITQLIYYGKYLYFKINVARLYRYLIEV